MQKISFNHMFGKSEILVTWHLRREVPRLTFLPKKSFVIETGRFQGCVQKGSPRVFVQDHYMYRLMIQNIQ